MDPITTPLPARRTNQAALWVLLVLIVGVTAGVGGYLLGKAKNVAEKSSSQAPIQHETGLAKFCSQGYCINYDQTKWQLDRVATASIEAPGDLVDLELKNDANVQVRFSTIGEWDGECENCYAYPVEIISHSKIANLFIVKILSYTRDANNSVLNVQAGFHVLDRASVNKYKLKVGQELTSPGGFKGFFRIENTSAPDDSVDSLLYWQDAKTYKTISEGKDVLELRSGSDANEAYAILTSLHKEE